MLLSLVSSPPSKVLISLPSSPLLSSPHSFSVPLLAFRHSRLPVLYVCMCDYFFLSLSFPSSLHLRPQTAYPPMVCGSATPISSTPSHKYCPQAGQTFYDLPKTQRTNTYNPMHMEMALLFRLWLSCFGLGV